MSWPGVFDPGNNCSWCGHRWPHDQPCPGTITVRRGRPPVEGTIPCPCQRIEGLTRSTTAKES